MIDQHEGLDKGAAIPPHPDLPAYFPSRAARSPFVRQLFNATAGDYDRINRVMSLGGGAHYRREVLRRAGLRAGMRVLDAATGTGLVAREAAAITGDPKLVIGLDLSERMLGRARLLGISLIQARAETLPLADQSVDFISMGYALRHASDLAALFADYYRVLRPGGRLVVMEIGRPTGRITHGLARLYLGWLIPAICGLLMGTEARRLMRYYWETIETCVAPEIVVNAMQEGGFTDARCQTSHGMFRDYLAGKPSL